MNADAEVAWLNLSSIGEFGLIARLADIVATDDPRVVIAVGDDCAVLEWTNDKYLLVTTDTLLEEVHFRLDWAVPEDVGWRAMAANLSDIAAMGGTPIAAVVGLAVHPSLDVETVEGIYEGMHRVASKYNTPIIGGDTVKSPSLINLSITVLGKVAKADLLTRSGAKPGDAIAVTGTLGDAAAGLAILEKGTGSFAPEIEGRLLTAHLQPEPRLREIHDLLKVLHPTACMDLSDGLGSDLHRLCEASGVGAEVELEKIPISVECHNIASLAGRHPLEFAIGGGEDFELLLTIPQESIEFLPKMVGEVMVKVIGRITGSEDGLYGIDVNGNRTEMTKGFEHF